MDSVQSCDSYTVCFPFNMRKAEDPLVGKRDENTVCLITDCAKYIFYVLHRCR
jgi:hypothetical protein